jgi:hypothetical protein
MEFWRTSLKKVTDCFPTLTDVLSDLESHISNGHGKLTKPKVAVIAFPAPGRFSVVMKPLLGFEVFTAVVTKSIIFWDLKLCSLLR